MSPLWIPSAMSLMKSCRSCGKDTDNVMTRPPPVPPYGTPLTAMDKNEGLQWMQNTQLYQESDGWRKRTWMLVEGTRYQRKDKKIGHGCKHTLNIILFIDQNNLPTSYVSYWEDPSIAQLAGV
jgi:hypothetical protein